MTNEIVIGQTPLSVEWPDSLKVSMEQCEQNMYSRSARMARALERDLLTFAIEYKTKRIYSLQFEETTYSTTKIAWSTYWKNFDFEHRAEAFHAMKELKNRGMDSKVVIYNPGRLLRLREPITEISGYAYKNLDLIQEYIKIMKEAIYGNTYSRSGIRSSIITGSKEQMQDQKTETSIQRP